MEQLSLDIGIELEDSLSRQTDRQPQTLAEKIEQAREAIVLAADMSKKYYNQPLIVTYSGGKDSDVLLHLAESYLKADEFEVLNSHTSVDAPQTVYHIREVFKRLGTKGIKATVYQPRYKDGTPITMWNLIPKKLMPPTRMVRYCCSVLKEASTPNRMCLTGVRGAESRNRQGRDIFNVIGKTYKDALYFSLNHAQEVHEEAQEIQDDAWDCTLIKTMKDHNNVVCTPIYYWEDCDIWDYIRQENIKVNPLYQMGYDRVGCVGCPLATHKKMLKEFEDFPQYKKAYIKAFDRMLEERKKAGKENLGNDFHHWETGEDVFEWWIEEYKRVPKGQMNLFD